MLFSYQVALSCNGSASHTASYFSIGLSRPVQMSPQVRLTVIRCQSKSFFRTGEKSYEHSRRWKKWFSVALLQVSSYRFKIKQLMWDPVIS